MLAELALAGVDAIEDKTEDLAEDISEDGAKDPGPGDPPLSGEDDPPPQPAKATNIDTATHQTDTGDCIIHSR